MLVSLIGVLGAGIILFAFLMNQFDKWKNDSFEYDFTNFVGSFVMVIYALLLQSWPFFILNFVWAIFSFKDVVRKLVNR